MAEKTVIEITGAFAPETVENVLQLLLEKMETLRVVDFTIETRQTSDEELVEELSDETSVESAEKAYINSFENLSPEEEEKFS